MTTPLATVDYINFQFLSPPRREELPRWLNIKNPPAGAGDTGSIPGWGRSPGEGNPLQYYCLENPTEEPGRLQSTGPQRVGHI